MTNLQAAKTTDAKNPAIVAIPLKTQDFREALRSASDPKPEQPAHGNADAKGEKKGHEEKKDQKETGRVSGTVAAPQIANAVTVPASGNSTNESEHDDMESNRKPAPSGNVSVTAVSFQVQTTIGSPMSNEGVANDSRNGSSLETSTPDKQNSGFNSKEATGESHGSGLKMGDRNVVPESAIIPAPPAKGYVAVDETTVVDPVGEVNGPASASKGNDAGKQTKTESEAKPAKTDAVSGQVGAQMPPPAVQEPAEPQITTTGELFKGSQVSAAKAPASVEPTASSSSKAKTEASDVRGKRDDVKVGPRGPDKDVAAQSPAKMPIPAGVVDVNAAHVRTSAGSEVVVSTQTNGAGLPSGDSSQNFAAPKDTSLDVDAVPMGAFTNNSDVSATPALNSAHLVQSIHQSEMKLGMNSVEFGSISISTAVSHQALSAQITLDHAELSRVLSNHLSAVEEKLGQAYGLQAKVEVRDGGASLYGGSQQREKDDTQSSRSLPSRGSGMGFAGKVSAPSATIVPASATSRLDIRI